MSTSTIIIVYQYVLYSYTFLPIIFDVHSVLGSSDKLALTIASVISFV